MNLHREGTTSIIIATVILSLIFIISFYLMGNWAWVVIVPAIIMWMLVIWFFRDPNREGEFDPNEVVAPVDGKVVVVKEVYEKEVLKANCIQVSIFMSPVNVHVCRYPVSGSVTYAKYHPGKYLVAWHEKSSELNERTTVCVKTESEKYVAFRQIAGALARRIVMYSEVGDEAYAGEEYGFIKFGSRVDVFLPLDSKILVKINDKTRGGIQKIAEIQ